MQVVKKQNIEVVEPLIPTKNYALCDELIADLQDVESYIFILSMLDTDLSDGVYTSFCGDDLENTISATRDIVMDLLINSFKDLRFDVRASLKLL